MKIHPLFFLIAIYFFAISKIELFAGYIVAIIVHENAHIFASKLKGYNLNNLTIMPYGGKVSGYRYNCAGDGLFIAFFGPLANIILACVLMSVIWLIEGSFKYLIDIVRANLYLAFINLFPIYPLDGAQVLFLFSKNKIRMSKNIKIASCIFGIIFVAVTVVSIFYKFCITLGIFGIFIVLSTFLDKDKFIYDYIYMQSLNKKDYSKPLLKLKMQVSKDANIYKLLSLIKSDCIIEFDIVDGKNKVIATLKEEQIKRALIQRENITKVKDIL